MLDFRNKLVLAPMVRVSELPLRKLSLNYGADLVWGPEIVDKRLIASRRVWNETLRTVDFVNLKNHTNLTWRMSPSLEKGKVVFQLGSADPQLAVAAAKVVANDVAAIDLNCGCPKHFSVHSGMGAQLLKTPAKLVEILTSLVREVGQPFGIPITAKIRVLPNPQETYDLVKQIVKTGIAHLTVHCRTPAMRPVESANYAQLPEIVRICHDAGITCYVNGDVRNREHMQSLISQYGVDGAMLARSAQLNPSSFSLDPPVPILYICREFLNACRDFDFNNAHSKYNLMNFVGGRSPLYALFAQSKSLASLNDSLRAHEAGPGEDWKVEETEETKDRETEATKVGETKETKKEVTKTPKNDQTKETTVDDAKEINGGDTQADKANDIKANLKTESEEAELEVNKVEAATTAPADDPEVESYAPEEIEAFRPHRKRAAEDSAPAAKRR